MNADLIETGRIINTHGIHGRLRLEPWADSPGLLTGIGYFYIDGAPFKVLSAEVHKNYLLVSLDGIDSIEKAIELKGMVVSVRRCDITRSEGTYFIADLTGLTVIDAENGAKIGKVKEILTLPANNVYVIDSVGGREIMVPAADEFIIETNLEDGYIKMKLIEGL